MISIDYKDGKTVVCEVEDYLKQHIAIATVINLMTWMVDVKLIRTAAELVKAVEGTDEHIISAEWYDD